MRVALLSGVNYGTNYYRASLVKRAADRWGATRGVEAFHVHLFSNGFLEKDSGIDVFYLLRPIPEMMPLELLHRLKRDGRPLVIDWDDDLFSVPKWSPSSTTFDLGGVREYCRGVMCAPDVVTATTEAGARAVREYMAELGAGDVPTRVIPNAFDPDLKVFRAFPEVSKPPAVGWQGGAQHEKDLAAIEPVFRECLKRGYGLRFIGEGPRGLRALSKKYRIEWIQGSHDVESFLQSLPLAGFDVAVAPLVDEKFNHSKSALKAAEYAWYAGCPSVLSDLSPYDEVPADGAWVQKVRGHDTATWMAAIERGIEVSRERGRCYRLPARYNLRHTFDRWVDAWNLAHRAVRGCDAPGYREGRAEVEDKMITREGVVAGVGAALAGR